MFQLERLNVVEKTLDQIDKEMKEGQVDEELSAMFSKINICRALTGEIAQHLVEKAKVSEEGTNEIS